MQGGLKYTSRLAIIEEPWIKRRYIDVLFFWWDVQLMVSRVVGVARRGAP